MQHRDYIIIRKVLDETQIGQDMIGDTSLDDFLADEN